MGKISTEARKRYFDKVKEYKLHIDKILQREKSLLELIQREASGAEYKKLTLADENLNLASYFILLNDVSVALLGVKNEGFLNDARKCCYKSVIYMEDVVTGFLDVPYSEYKEKVEAIEGFEDDNRYQFVRKLGFCIQSVVEGFGVESKWKWSFVELEGRFAVIAKNLINMKTLIAGLDPSMQGYQARVSHLNLVKDLLARAADRYREKYEISTTRIDDFKKAIAFLSTLRRLYLMLGETAHTENVKKKIDAWMTKMDADERKSETKTNSSAG
jgi:hypothetical protein